MNVGDDTQFRVVSELRRECREDYVGLWQVLARLSGARVRPTREDVVAIAMALLDDPSIVVGEFDDEGFAAWAGTRAQVRERLAEAIGRAAWPPDIGDVAWFTAGIGEK